MTPKSSKTPLKTNFLVKEEDSAGRRVATFRENKDDGEAKEDAIDLLGAILAPAERYRLTRIHPGRRVKQWKCEAFIK